jgi:hypothetical protein
MEKAVSGRRKEGWGGITPSIGRSHVKCRVVRKERKEQQGEGKYKNHRFSHR